MKISIITPAYNAERTLEKTILSVINQEIEAELEYIVIDGNSTDKTLDIIQKYQNRINLFISETDKGVYDAMNKGIAHAAGDIIGIINADDWYNGGALKIVEETFKKDEKIEIIYSPVETYYDHQYLIQFRPGSLDKLFFKFTINHPSCFVRKTVYARLGSYDLSYSIAADYDFILRAYTFGAIFSYVEEPLASYSLNGLSGQPLAKFKQLHQSWLVGSKYIDAAAASIRSKRRLFYLNWLLKEVLVFPIKHFINPHLARQMKAQLRNLMGGRLPSDHYGAW